MLGEYTPELGVKGSMGVQENIAFVIIQQSVVSSIFFAVFEFNI